VEPSGGLGKLSSPQDHGDVKMIVPARAGKSSALPQADQQDVATLGHLVFGHSIMKPLAAPLVTERRSTSAASIAPTIPKT
jgi:hypothetical protein